MEKVSGRKPEFSNKITEMKKVKNFFSVFYDILSNLNVAKFPEKIGINCLKIQNVQFFEFRISPQKKKEGLV